MSKINIAMDSQILTSLMNCPRLTDYRFNRHLIGRGGKSNALECGSLVHTILEFYAKAIIAGNKRDDAMAIGFAAGKEYIAGYNPTNKYILDPNETGMKNTPEESGKDQYNKEHIGHKYVFDTMYQYFDHYRNDNLTIISAEEVRGEVIYEDESIRVLWKAKFDRVVDSMNGILSMDHKTRSRARDDISLNNQFMGQCTLLKARNVIIDVIGFQKSLKPNEKFQRNVISYTADQLAEWRNEVVPHYANMLVAYNEAQNFPPNYNHCDKYFKCQFYKDVCTVDRGMREEALNIYFEKGKVWDISND